jgi:transposase
MFVLGIDVSKAKLDVSLLEAEGSPAQAQFGNEAAGLKKLGQWLKKQQVEQLHVCLEATNIYWELAADYLHEQGYQVSVVNPARIKGFAQSQLRRNKTDKLDSLVIAQFCATMKPKAWQPPNPTQRKLRALVRHSQALQKTLTQQKNRRAVCTEPAVQHSLDSLSQSLQTEIERIEQQIQELIEAEAELKRQQKLLTSIKGFGNKTAAFLLAEMYDLASYDSARAAAADAGLTPAHHTSGSSVHRKPKLSKLGKAAVRGALYFPAISAIRSNPLVQALTDRLAARGKGPLVLIAAAMRKLLHLAYGVLKHQLPFDPHYLHKLPAQT